MSSIVCASVIILGHFVDAWLVYFACLATNNIAMT